MPASRRQLSPRLRVWTYATLTVLFGSGLVWWALQRWALVDTDFGPAAHPLSPWMLKLHGLAAMAFLIVLGVLVPEHMRRCWHAEKNRLSGVGMITVLIILSISGWLLYYAGNEHLRALTSDVHVWLGLAVPIIVAGHVILGRRSR